jgi:hypothetical protein
MILCVRIIGPTGEDLLHTSQESLVGCFFDRMDRVRGLGVESENGGKP